MQKHTSSKLNRILLSYMFGGALGAAAFVYILKILGLLPPEAALFLVPMILGCTLIERAYRMGVGAGQASAGVPRTEENRPDTGGL
jgi:hypothetical protein